MKSQNKLIKKIKEFLVNLLIKRKPLTHTVIFFFIYIQGILITSAASVVEGVCQNGVLMMIHG